MDNKRNKILKIIRIITYIAIIISLIILKYTNVFNFTCYINQHFGVLCPSCGITRAVRAIVNYDFTLAIKNNAYCTLILFPIFFILCVDDIICMIFNKKSFIEIILGE